MGNRYRPIYLLPAVLALAGPLVLVVATRGGFLPLAFAWWAVSFVVACIGSRKARIGLSLLLMPACVLLAFEGGLFMLPALISMFLIDVASGSAPTSAETPQHARH